MKTNVFFEAATLRKRALEELGQMAETASVEDDTMFVTILALCPQVLELSEGEIADALMVSRPTVNRWINAQSDPHPAMRKPIYGWILKQARRRLRASESPNRETAAASRIMVKSKSAGH